MVTRHHVKQPDHRDDGGVGGADEKEEENNAHDPAEGLTEKRTETLGAELFADEAQGIFTAEMEGFPHGMRAIGQHDGRVRIQRKHCPTKQSRTDDDFDGNWPNRFGGFAGDFRMMGCRIWVELHHASQVRDRLDTAKSENDPYKLHPELRRVFVRALEVMGG